MRYFLESLLHGLITGRVIMRDGCFWTLTDIPHDRPGDRTVTHARVIINGADAQVTYYAYENELKFAIFDMPDGTQIKYIYDNIRPCIDTEMIDVLFIVMLLGCLAACYITFAENHPFSQDYGPAACTALTIVTWISSIDLAFNIRHIILRRRVSEEFARAVIANYI